MRLSRRDVLAGSGVALAASCQWHAVDACEPYRPKGNLKQSVCRWCYGNVPLEKLAEEAARLGYKSVELLLPKDILTVKKYGLTCAVVGGADIAHGLNRQEYHGKILKELQERIEFAAAEGCRNVICMSGNRTINGTTVSDEEGLETCVQALKKIVGLAEQKKVTLVMEGLNSKHDHKDYMYDKTEWGVKLCKKVGSERFKLLYDIYHMQIMEGDVIATINAYKDFIAHYHTGGVPGRHEIDETQELHYPAIVQAILQTGFDGYLAQEYIPKKGHDPLQSLAVGFRVCDV